MHSFLCIAIFLLFSQVYSNTSTNNSICLSTNLSNPSLDDDYFHIYTQASNLYGNFLNCLQSVVIHNSKINDVDLIEKCSKDSYLLIKFAVLNHKATKQMFTHIIKNNVTINSTIVFLHDYEYVLSESIKNISKVSDLYLNDIHTFYYIIVILVSLLTFFFGVFFGKVCI